MANFKGCKSFIKKLLQADINLTDHAPTKVQMEQAVLSRIKLTFNSKNSLSVVMVTAKDDIEMFSTDVEFEPGTEIILEEIYHVYKVQILGH